MESLDYQIPITQLPNFKKRENAKVDVLEY